MLVFIVVVGATPDNCSFPFTYNGGLYYSCIENMAAVSTAQQPLACINVNATPANCDCPGSFFRQQLYFHNWWLLWFTPGVDIRSSSSRPRSNLPITSQDRDETETIRL